jgi:hypothetical protein
MIYRSMTTKTESSKCDSAFAGRCLSRTKLTLAKSNSIDDWSTRNKLFSQLSRSTNDSDTPYFTLISSDRNNMAFQFLQTKVIGFPCNRCRRDVSQTCVKGNISYRVLHTHLALLTSSSPNASSCWWTTWDCSDLATLHRRWEMYSTALARANIDSFYTSRRFD